jgi:IMP dehydrogenase
VTVQGGSDRRGRQGADPQAPPRARPGHQRRLRAARPDHRQGHHQDHRTPDASKDASGRLRVGAAIGVGPGTEERAELLAEAGVDVLVVDTAHGHSQGVLDRVRWVKKNFPQVEVIGGNIATADAARRWSTTVPTASRSASARGRSAPRASSPASACRRSPPSRTFHDALKGSGVPMIADGGIRYSGDISKAIAAGGDAVMLGGLFAGTEEAPGEVELFQGRSYKSYRGMGSIGAMAAGRRRPLLPGHGQRRQAGARRHRRPRALQGFGAGRDSSVDGRPALVDGLPRLPDDRRNARAGQFVEITSAGVRESHVHDVQITKEAPNYHVD